MRDDPLLWMVIECHGLTKEFRTYKKQPGFLGTLKSFFVREQILNRAVDHFDLLLEPGALVGLLGPNGAGKTTLMKMLTGIIVPSSGKMKVLGFTPSERKLQFRRKIALVMGQKNQLWWDIPAMDSFLLLQKYYEIADGDFKKRVGFLSEMLDVEKVLHIHVRKLSLGERMKLELMASLLHEPEVIFLDEPTIGLDLVAQKNIRDFLRVYQEERQTTILLTSHYMADVEALCSRIVLILGGKKRFDDSITKFSQILGREKFVTFTFERGVDQTSEIWKSHDPKWKFEGRQVELRIPEERLRELSATILNQYPVVDFHTEKMPIERVMSTLISNPHLL